MRKFLLLIIFILINMSTNLYATSPEMDEFQTIDTIGLKILSWNIYMLPYISLFNQNAIRAKTIAERLNKSDYNIIVFQEAFSSKCRNILSSRLKANYPYQYGPANKNFLPFMTNSGLWIVSKLPLTKLQEFQFSKSKGFDAIARKGAVLFEGNFKGSPFQLLTTHLQADFSHTVRNTQCMEIKDQLLNKFYREDTPQFICGDFNIDMDDEHNYKNMLKTLDAQNGELSGNVKFTYDEVENNLAKSPQGKRKVIDYVLVRNSSLIHKIERKAQTFLTSIGKQVTNLSDHYAMEFQVNFAPTITNTSSQLFSER